MVATISKIYYKMCRTSAYEGRTSIYCLAFFSNDKGKPAERQGRKAKGPVRWQPASERRDNYDHGEKNIDYYDDNYLLYCCWNLNQISLIDRFLTLFIMISPVTPRLTGLFFCPKGGTDEQRKGLVRISWQKGEDRHERRAILRCGFCNLKIMTPLFRGAKWSNLFRVHDHCKYEFERGLALPVDSRCNNRLDNSTHIPDENSCKYD